MSGLPRPSLELFADSVDSAAPGSGLEAAGPFSIVCLSRSRGTPISPPTASRSLKRVALRGNRVLYVETGAFLGRHLVRLRRAENRRSLLTQLVGHELSQPGIAVRKALNVAPWGHTLPLASAVNSRLTACVVRRIARTLPQPFVLSIYDPCTAPMIGACGEALALYDCVDDHAELVRDDPRKRAFVAACDAVAAQRARLVSTTTDTLYLRHRDLNPRTYLVRNAGDYGHSLPAAERSFAAPEVQGLPRPVIGFVGNFVPRYVAAFDVGLCPYVWNDWMRSGFPLKLYEYLAAGKPVVASGNPDLVGMEPDVLVARGADAFVAAVDAALERRGDEDRARRIRTASRNTWERRAQRLLDLVTMEIG